MNTHFHRRNLPHLYLEEGKYFITYRLVNSIPANKLNDIKTPSRDYDFNKFKRLFIKYDSLIDSGKYGVNYLSDKKVSEICKETIHHPDGNDYKLISYCIMPNHVHLIFDLKKNNKSISQIMRLVKGISARRANKILHRKGKFWQDESYDRLIRGDIELYFVIKYTLLNPVNAGLVKNWNDWQYTYCHPDYLVL